MKPFSYPVGGVLLVAFSLILSGCDSSAPTPPVAPGGVAKVDAPKHSVEEPRNEIKAENLSEVMKLTREGLGLMEQYEYAKAAEKFRRVHELSPGWIPGSINLAIALLNDTGNKAEEAKKVAGASAAVSSNFAEALSLLDDVIRREPRNPHARYCRGIILKYLSGDPDHPDNIVRAHEDFKVVAELDPSDGHAIYKMGDSLYDPESVKSEFGPRPAGPRQAKQLIELYTRAMERNPYLVANLYQLQQAYGFAREPEKQRKILDLWTKLNPQRNAAGPGEIVGNFYGDMGKYAQVINPFGSEAKPGPPAAPPRFEVPRPIDVKLPEATRWAKAADFAGPLAPLGAARARFGATVVTLDVNKDGKLDLFLAAAVVGPKGVRDALLINKGEGKYEETALAAGLSETRASLSAAAADFDADLHSDLCLAGLDGVSLWRASGKGRFEDVTKAAGIEGKGVVSLAVRFLDLDQDGDLDLYVLNYCKAADAADALAGKKVPGVTNAAYRNDGKPPAITGRPEDNHAPVGVATDDLKVSEGLTAAFTPWPALAGTPSNYTGIAALDLDNDRDLDLVLTSDDQAAVALMNDRLGAFHALPLPGLTPKGKVSGLAAFDIDKDGRVDLVATSADDAGGAWLNTGESNEKGFAPSFKSVPAENGRLRGAFAADVDLDTWTDLLGLPSGDRAPVAAFNRKEKFAKAVPLALGPDSEAGLVGLAFADLEGDALPDLILVRDGEAPRISVNKGNGNHWVSIRLGGRWKRSHDHMRTNSEGIGARLTLEGDGLLARYNHAAGDAMTGQSSGPIVIGLGSSDKIPLMHVRWPDGVMQCELALNADVTVPVVEYNRKTGSCPVLFTWNGERFVCLGDFLGGGGMGYLVAPGVYSQPDRDEAMAIAGDQLKPVDGVFRISVTEPMDEVAYLDRLFLEVVDRPPGVNTVLDERFAPEGPRPSGALLAYRRTVEPLKVVDHQGVDRTETLRKWDRLTADGFRRKRGWIGYAEEHSITLDFGDLMGRFAPGEKVVLALAGWVEYPYSQTNYAAASAGVALKPPILERRKADGSWEVIDPSPGYPAGLPRMMSVDLTGKVGDGPCVLRISTNMECYWDQAFLAAVAAEPTMRITRVEVKRATLGPRGYTREISPDARQPLIYDYDYVDPAPLARLSGKLTRFGDVTELLTQDDDRLCVVGPGDEAKVEFEARDLPDLPAGWTRSYVLRSFGYCKDADPLTAGSDTIEPLPWRGMPEFPFAKPVSRRLDPAYRTYLEAYQTRSVGRD